MNNQVHYIWLDYIHYQANGKEGSNDSILVFNGDIPLEKAKKMIDGVTLKYCKDWMAKRSKFFSQKGIEVKMAAQNISTSKVLYEKIIGTI